MSFIGKIANYSDPNSIGSRMRRRRSARLRVLIEECYQRQHKVSIIDLGGEAIYWDIFEPPYLRSRNVTILLANKYPDSVPLLQGLDTSIFDRVSVDCCALPYPTRTFDIAHSNSVIEHVGDWDAVMWFANEARRVANAYFVQTPAFWFPFEPHFGRPLFHWLPEATRAAALLRGRVGHYPQADTLDTAMRHVQYVRLLDHKQMVYLFPGAEIVRERVLGLTKSYTAIRDMLQSGTSESLGNKPGERQNWPRWRT